MRLNALGNFYVEMTFDMNKEKGVHTEETGVPKVPDPTECQKGSLVVMEKDTP